MGSINRYQFKAMNKRTQLQYLRLHGKILHRRARGTCEKVVYKVRNFYIEVWTDLAANRVENLTLFKDDALLKFAVS